MLLGWGLFLPLLLEVLVGDLRALVSKDWVEALEGGLHSSKGAQRRLQWQGEKGLDKHARYATHQQALGLLHGHWV